MWQQHISCRYVCLFLTYSVCYAAFFFCNMTVQAFMHNVRQVKFLLISWTCGLSRVPVYLELLVCCQLLQSAWCLRAMRVLSSECRLSCRYAFHLRLSFVYLHRNYWCSLSAFDVGLPTALVCMCTGSLSIDQCICPINTWIDKENQQCVACGNSTSPAGTKFRLFMCTTCSTSQQAFCLPHGYEMLDHVLFVWVVLSMVCLIKPFAAFKCF